MLSTSYARAKTLKWFIISMATRRAHIQIAVSATLSGSEANALTGNNRRAKLLQKGRQASGGSVGRTTPGQRHLPTFQKRPKRGPSQSPRACSSGAWPTPRVLTLRAFSKQARQHWTFSTQWLPRAGIRNRVARVPCDRPWAEHPPSSQHFSLHTTVFCPSCVQPLVAHPNMASRLMPNADIVLDSMCSHAAGKMHHKYAYCSRFAALHLLAVPLPGPYLPLPLSPMTLA